MPYNQQRLCTAQKYGNTAIKEFISITNRNNINNKQINKKMKKLILMLMLFAPIATFAQKFGHINSQTVIESLPEYVKARAEVEGQAKAFDNDLQAMQKEIQTKAEAYDKSASTMNDTKRKETEAELQGLYQKFQQAQQDNSEQFQQEQQKKLQPITQKVLNAVNTVAQEGGYVYIVDKNASQQAGILINESLSTDVTSIIMKKLGISAAAAAKTGTATPTKK